VISLISQSDFECLFFQTYVEIFHGMHSANQVAILLSLISISILVFNNEYLKPRVAKKSKIPTPIELIAVVGGTLLSRLLKMEESWAIASVGHIPVGLPQPVMPSFGLWKELLVDSFAIAFVSYSVTISMALIFGQKLKYEIDFNQELLAMGIGNILASFFSCFPFSASLSRSLIQQAVGGKTQLASIISCVLLLFVLLWVGPFFEVLPRVSK
jgi:solute carrier family 26, other